MTLRFLSPADLEVVRIAFNKAFADYFVESQLSAEQLANHLRDSAVRLELSIGAFEQGEMIGMLLNGIDEWGGQLTAYDAGTGVVPAHRGHGVAGEMFRFAVPRLAENGVRRCLLEVIRENEPAIRAYRELGFIPTRELQCFKRPAEPFSGSATPAGAPGSLETPDVALRIEEMRETAWDLWMSFWDWQPSWQNSPGAVARGSGRGVVLGAFRDGRCVGYVVFVPAAGRILQFAVAKDARRQGLGTRLLRSVRAQAAPDRDLTIINVEAAATGTAAFLRTLGFVPTIGQYEMTRAL